MNRAVSILLPRPRCVIAVQNLDGWYDVSMDQIREAGGEKLLEHYNGSIYKALKTIYPNFNWEFWRFQVLEIPEISK